MDARAETATGANAREIVVTRDYDQPREAVFKAWTNAEQLKRWWAPAGCTTPFCTVDLRSGGKFHYCIRLPDGRDIWGLGIYREIVVPERIVYVDSFADAEGTPVPPSHYFMSAEQPERSLVTVTFSENDGRTTLTLHHAIGPEVKEREQIRQGWNEMLDRLADDFAAA
jgi:uncharacterized protein YndB with AHSA1/START domain